MKKKIRLRIASELSSVSVGYDPRQMEPNQNTIIWSSEWEFHPDAMAITLVSYKRDSGEIVDADILFNGKNYNWFQKASSEGMPSKARSRMSQEKERFKNRGREEKERARSHQKPWIDIENTAAHEIGHLLGLGHSLAEEATMFREQGSGETKKRSLASDDLEAVAVLYRLSESKKSGEQAEIEQKNANVSLSPQPQIGCSTLGERSLPTSSFLSFLFLLFPLFFSKWKQWKIPSGLFSFLFVAGAVGSLFGSTAYATSIAKMDLKTITNRAAYVIVGRVGKQVSIWKKGRIYTLSTVLVKKCIKGTCTKKKMYVQQIGGVIGNIGMFAHGISLLKPNHKVLLFLYRRHASVRSGRATLSLHRIVGVSQGSFLFVKHNQQEFLKPQVTGHLLSLDSSTNSFGSKKSFEWKRKKRYQSSLFLRQIERFVLSEKKTAISKKSFLDSSQKTKTTKK